MSGMKIMLQSLEQSKAKAVPKEKTNAEIISDIVSTHTGPGSNNKGFSPARVNVAEDVSRLHDRGQTLFHQVSLGNKQKNSLGNNDLLY